VKKKKIYRQNIFLQVLSFIAFKNNTLRRFVNTLSDRLAKMTLPSKINDWKMLIF